MSGVSVDTTPVASISPEFAAAMDGGENFLKRLGALQQAKKEHDAALAAMNLGASVTQAKLEVDHKHTIANQRIADAHVKADQIVNEATAKAKKILADAQSKSDEIAAAATAAHQRAAVVLEDASKTMDAAQSTKAASDKSAAEAEALKAQHATALKAAEAAIAAATAKESELSAKIKQVTELAKFIST